MVLVVLLQMLSEVIDPLCEQSNLNVGAPGIAVMHLERFNCFVLEFHTVRFQINRIPQSRASPEGCKEIILRKFAVFGGFEAAVKLFQRGIGVRLLLEFLASFLFLFFVLFAVGIIVGGNEERAALESSGDDQKREEG